MSFLDLTFAQTLTIDQMADIEEAMQPGGADFDPETGRCIMLLQPEPGWLKQRKYTLTILDLDLEIVLLPQRWFLSLPMDPDDPEMTVTPSAAHYKLLAK